MRMRSSDLKDLRLGDNLWDEWPGDAFDVDDDCILYCTAGHVSLSEELVRRALASTLQRDGVADSLAEGFRIIEECRADQLWSGFLTDEVIPVLCNEKGVTALGDIVENAQPTTFVLVGSE